MQLGQRLASLRQEHGLTQDDLATKIYVSRQTISSWENDHSYPDVDNLVRLSLVFDVTLDDLVKGDLQTMKAKIQSAGMDLATKWMLGGLLAGILAIGPALFLPTPWWFLLPGSGWLVAMVASLRVERYKKQADIKTYREIIAFDRGEDVEALRQTRRPWRDSLAKAGIVLVFTAAAAVLALIMALPYVLLHR